MLDDASLDARRLETRVDGEHRSLTVAEVIRAVHARFPAEDALRAAAVLHDSPSPAMLEAEARWLEIDAAFAAGGLSASERLRVLLRACRNKAFGVHGPDGAVLDRAFGLAGDDGAALAREFCVWVAALPMRDFTLDQAALAGLATLARRGEAAPEALDELVTLMAPAATLRALLAAMPPERRERVMVRMTNVIPAANHAFLLDRFLAIHDLAGPDAHAGAEALLAAARGKGGDVSALEARLRAGGERPDAVERPTERARQALEYNLRVAAARRLRNELAASSQRLHDRAVRVGGAPELASLELWRGASAARREQLARAVAGALGGDFTLAGIETFAGGPIAVYAHAPTGLRLSLVPGGMAQRGLSPQEEALIAVAAEKARGDSDWPSEFGRLLEELGALRPAGDVRVGPLLAAQGPGKTLPPQAVMELVEPTPFRLPSEAEWEHLARGGRRRELTYRGNERPDARWFEETCDLGPKTANAFGLWGFGLEPEVCSDVWRDNHEGAPGDGGPRRGDGQAVVRGGAAQLYPWQSCGEWHLLLSAMRLPLSHWEFAVGVRPVLGVTLS
jgi:hypothetical protein